MKNKYLGISIAVFLYICAPNLSFSQSNQGSDADNNHISSEPRIALETSQPPQEKSLKNWIGNIKPAAGPFNVDDRKITQRVPYWQQRVHRPLK